MVSTMKLDSTCKPKTPASSILLLLTIAVVALTSACMIFKYSSNRSYHKKWKDYDDCGLA